MSVTAFPEAIRSINQRRKSTTREQLDRNEKHFSHTPASLAQKVNASQWFPATLDPSQENKPLSRDNQALSSFENPTRKSHKGSLDSIGFQTISGLNSVRFTQNFSNKNSIVSTPHIKSSKSIVFSTFKGSETLENGQVNLLLPASRKEKGYGKTSFFPSQSFLTKTQSKTKDKKKEEETINREEVSMKMKELTKLNIFENGDPDIKKTSSGFFWKVFTLFKTLDENALKILVGLGILLGKIDEENKALNKRLKSQTTRIKELETRAETSERELAKFKAKVDLFKASNGLERFLKYYEEDPNDSETKKIDADHKNEDNQTKEKNNEKNEQNGSKSSAKLPRGLSQIGVNYYELPQKPAINSGNLKIENQEKESSLPLIFGLGGSMDGKQDLETVNWIVEKARMQKELESLKEQIFYQKNEESKHNILEENEKIKTLSAEIFKKLEAKIKQRDMALSKMEIEKFAAKNLAKTAEENLLNTNERLKEVNLKLKETNETLESVRKSEDKLKEISKVRKVQLREMTEAMQKMDSHLKREKRKNAELTRTIGSLNSESINMNQLMNGEEFEKDEEHLKFIRGDIAENVPDVFGLKTKKLDIFEEKKGPKKMEELCIFRPTFFILISETYESFLETINSKQTNALGKFAMTFIGLMRGCLDAKFTEEMARENEKSIAKFVDFSYGFLGKYTVDLNKGTLREIGGAEYDSQDEPRCLFFFSLYHSRYNRLWEVLFFRKCLEERHSPDHLFFLLKCRDILFGGPQLKNHSLFEFVNYIKWTTVEPRLMSIMSKFQKSMVGFVLDHVRKRLQKKNDLLMVDPYFILQILSELYTMDQMEKMSRIQESLSQNMACTSPRVKKTTVPYSLFKKMIDTNYPNASQTDRARIYRDAFCIGNGYVTPESVYTAASDLGFFSRFVRVSEVSGPPYPLDSEGEIIQSSLASRLAGACHKELQLKVYDRLSSYSQDLTIEDIASESWEVALAIRNKFQIENGEFKGKPSHQLSLNLLLQNIKAMHLVSSGQLNSIRCYANERLIESIYLENFKILRQIGEKTQKIENLLKSEEKRKEKRIIFLQRFIRRRLEQMTHTELPI